MTNCGVIEALLRLLITGETKDTEITVIVDWGQFLKDVIFLYVKSDDEHPLSWYKVI